MGEVVGGAIVWARSKLGGGKEASSSLRSNSCISVAVRLFGDAAAGDVTSAAAASTSDSAVTARFGLAVNSANSASRN